ncbi:MAG: ABC transporter ATP-binding protein [Acidimicrobiales bacterium]|nr:ABC transporter ATP-binding protein [Acidimicrobiales bacterium]
MSHEPLDAAPAETPRRDAHDAAVDALESSAPAGGSDHERRHREATPEEDALQDAGAVTVLRRGVAATPELREGLLLTGLLAILTAAGKLAVPILIQQTLDRGVLGDRGYRAGFVAVACAGTALLTIVLYALNRGTFRRLVRAAEASLLGLRLRTFSHIHRLSIAEHVDHRRGALVARVTSDVETLAQFTEWGAVAWIVDSTLLVATLAVMAVYSWQLTLVAMAVFVPLLPLLRALQRRQLAAYDDVRNAVGGTLSEVSELVSGAPVVLAYGLEGRARRRLDAAIDKQYRAHLRGAKWFSIMFPLADLFGAVALAAVVAAGAINGEAWGLGFGELVAFLFLVNLLLTPISQLTEILDQTQTAIAGWRKILGVLATPVDVEEPVDGASLPQGPLAVDLEGVRFAYREGGEVLRGLDLHLPAGCTVAVVGETGSGKTTIAKLLCRLADPTAGVVRVGGVDLREVAPESRHARIRMVPQDGFLFDAPLADNVRMGRVDATDTDVDAAFASLGLSGWVDDLPGGIHASVGERGGNLSVGERQLVALARAQLGDPGLLILDEATSSVDPETEQALANALDRLATGRTVVSIAHRLSTAERADVVVVVDAGEIVEHGPHAELLGRGGVYSGLFESWLGNTRAG